MASFDRLSPALQAQIVNQLGWTALRPVQEQTIDAVLDGCNAVVLAPTAGGKTEAALFPLLSRMDTEGWGAPSVLYLAPIRALLNNQEARLERLSGLIGRRAFKWHGDVGASGRTRFVRDPADILATTPESLEAMLMSRRVPGAELLRGVQAVIVDEVHAFAGDDRGAHLSALLERFTRLAGRDLQRIGLSATVGDPEVILRWLSGSSRRPGRVVRPGGAGAEPKIQLDFVGDLSNAALMIDRLYPGTRRLVFVDSRRRVEQLGAELARRKVNVFVTHSSLAHSERAAAERAFEEGQNCVIVATSALELGIDVGDLDHVLQVDCPATVSSFLQRMGRTGRRPGTRPSCTFLATTEDAALQSAALLRLHARGYVEPAAPSDRAAHVLAHQLLALSIQEQGVPGREWWSWLQGAASFSGLSAGERAALLEHMLDQDILHLSDARLSLGLRGERLYAGRNFMELYAVFSTPPVLTVMHGNREVGSIDAWFLMRGDAGPMAFVLAGRAWQVAGVDWGRGTVAVRPAEAGAWPRWMGQPVLLSRPLCQAQREVLLGRDHDPWWTKRAATVLDELRESYHFLDDSPAPLVSEPNKVRWWTFGGGRANGLLAAALEARLGEKVTANNLCVTFSQDAARSDVAISEAIRALSLPGELTWARALQHAPDLARGRISKFQPCLPDALERDLLARTLLDLDGARKILALEPTLAEVRVSPEAEARGLAEAERELAPRVLAPLPPERARSRPGAARPSREVRHVRTAEALEALVAELLSEPVVGLDVETTLQDQALCLVQLGCPRFTALVDPLALDDLRPLGRLLGSEAVVKVIHNAAFERKVLGGLGFEIHNVFDTLSASRQQRGRTLLGGHSLAAVCERELEIILDKGEQTSDWRQRPLSEEQVAYAALDAEVLVALWAVFGEGARSAYR